MDTGRSLSGSGASFAKGLEERKFRFKALQSKVHAVERLSEQPWPGSAANLPRRRLSDMTLSFKPRFRLRLVGRRAVSSRAGTGHVRPSSRPQECVAAQVAHGAHD